MEYRTNIYCYSQRQRYCRRRSKCANWFTYIICRSQDDEKVFGSVNTQLGTVDLTFVNNDEAGIVVSPNSLSIDERKEGAFTVKLSSKPSDNITLQVVPSDSTILSPQTLTFTSTNWDDVQTVVVFAKDDGRDEPNDNETINVEISDTGSDTFYEEQKNDSAHIKTITVAINDTGVDSYNIEIVAGDALTNIDEGEENNEYYFKANATDAQLGIDKIEAALNQGKNVLISTNDGNLGKINFNEQKDFNVLSDLTLKLNAGEIVINKKLFDVGDNKLNITLEADGDVVVNKGIITNGGNFKVRGGDGETGAGSFTLKEASIHTWTVENNGGQKKVMGTVDIKVEERAFWNAQDQEKTSGKLIIENNSNVVTRAQINNDDDDAGDINLEATNGIELGDDSELNCISNAGKNGNITINNELIIKGTTRFRTKGNIYFNSTVDGAANQDSKLIISEGDANSKVIFKENIGETTPLHTIDILLSSDVYLESNVDEVNTSNEVKWLGNIFVENYDLGIVAPAIVPDLASSTDYERRLIWIGKGFGDNEIVGKGEGDSNPTWSVKNQLNLPNKRHYYTIKKYEVGGEDQSYFTNANKQNYNYVIEIKEYYKKVEEKYWVKNISYLNFAQEQQVEEIDDFWAADNTISASNTAKITKVNIAYDKYPEGVNLDPQITHTYYVEVTFDTPVDDTTQVFTNKKDSIVFDETCIDIEVSGSITGIEILDSTFTMDGASESLSDKVWKSFDKTYKKYRIPVKFFGDVDNGVITIKPNFDTLFSTTVSLNHNDLINSISNSGFSLDSLDTDPDVLTINFPKSLIEYSIKVSDDSETISLIWDIPVFREDLVTDLINNNISDHTNVAIKQSFVLSKTNSALFSFRDNWSNPWDIGFSKQINDNKHQYDIKFNNLPPRDSNSDGTISLLGDYNYIYNQFDILHGSSVPTIPIDELKHNQYVYDEHGNRILLEFFTLLRYRPQIIEFQHFSVGEKSSENGYEFIRSFKLKLDARSVISKTDIIALFSTDSTKPEHTDIFTYVYSGTGTASNFRSYDIIGISDSQNGAPSSENKLRILYDGYFNEGDTLKITGGTEKTQNNKTNTDLISNGDYPLLTSNATTPTEAGKIENDPIQVMEFTIVHKENTTFTATIKFNMPVTTNGGGNLTKDQLIFNFNNETVLPTSDDSDTQWTDDVWWDNVVAKDNNKTITVDLTLDNDTFEKASSGAFGHTGSTIQKIHFGSTSVNQQAIYSIPTGRGEGKSLVLSTVNYDIANVELTQSIMPTIWDKRGLHTGTYVQSRYDNSKIIFEFNKPIWKNNDKTGTFGQGDFNISEVVVDKIPIKYGGIVDDNNYKDWEGDINNLNNLIITSFTHNNSVLEFSIQGLNVKNNILNGKNLVIEYVGGAAIFDDNGAEVQFSYNSAFNGLETDKSTAIANAKKYLIGRFFNTPKYIKPIEFKSLVRGSLKRKIIVEFNGHVSTGPNSADVNTNLTTSNFNVTVSGGTVEGNRTNLPTPTITSVTRENSKYGNKWILEITLDHLVADDNITVEPVGVFSGIFSMERVENFETIPLISDRPLLKSVNFDYQVISNIGWGGQDNFSVDVIVDWPSPLYSKLDPTQNSALIDNNGDVSYDLFDWDVVDGEGNSLGLYNGTAFKKASNRSRGQLLSKNPFTVRYFFESQQQEKQLNFKVTPVGAKLVTNDSPALESWELSKMVPIHIPVVPSFDIELSQDNYTLFITFDQDVYANNNATGLLTKQNFGILFTGKDTSLDYSQSVFSKVQNQPPGFTTAKWQLQLSYTPTSSQTGIQYSTDEIILFVNHNKPIYNTLGSVLDTFRSKTFLTDKTQPVISSINTNLTNFDIQIVFDRIITGSRDSTTNSLIFNPPELSLTNNFYNFNISGGTATIPDVDNDGIPDGWTISSIGKESWAIKPTFVGIPDGREILTFKLDNIFDVNENNVDPTVQYSFNLLDQRDPEIINASVYYEDSLWNHHLFVVIFNKNVYSPSGLLSVNDFEFQITGGQSNISLKPIDVRQLVNNQTRNQGYKERQVWLITSKMTSWPRGDETIKVILKNQISDQFGKKVQTLSRNADSGFKMEGPVITSTTLSGDSSKITVTFDKQIYNTTSGTAPIKENFKFTIQGNNTIIDFKSDGQGGFYNGISSIIETVVGGVSKVELFLEKQTPFTRNEQIVTVSVVDIVDQYNNESRVSKYKIGDVTTEIGINAVRFPDDVPPKIHKPATLSNDNSLLTFEFDSNIKTANGNVTKDDFDFDLHGTGGPYNSQVIRNLVITNREFQSEDDRINSNKLFKFNIKFDGIPEGSQYIKVKPKAGRITDYFNNALNLNDYGNIEGNNTVYFYDKAKPLFFHSNPMDISNNNSEIEIYFNENVYSDTIEQMYKEQRTSRNNLTINNLKLEVIFELNGETYIVVQSTAFDPDYIDFVKPQANNDTRYKITLKQTNLNLIKAETAKFFTKNPAASNSMMELKLRVSPGEDPIYDEFGNIMEINTFASKRLYYYPKILDIKINGNNSEAIITFNCDVTDQYGAFINSTGGGGFTMGDYDGNGDPIWKQLGELELFHMKDEIEFNNVNHGITKVNILGLFALPRSEQPEGFLTARWKIEFTPPTPLIFSRKDSNGSEVFPDKNKHPTGYEKFLVKPTNVYNGDFKAVDHPDYDDNYPSYAFYTTGPRIIKTEISDDNRIVTVTFDKDAYITNGGIGELIPSNFWIYPIKDFDSDPKPRIKTVALADTQPEGFTRARWNLTLRGYHPTQRVWSGEANFTSEIDDGKFWVTKPKTIVGDEIYRLTIGATDDNFYDTNQTLLKNKSGSDFDTVLHRADNVFDEWGNKTVWDGVHHANNILGDMRKLNGTYNGNKVSGETLETGLTDIDNGIFLNLNPANNLISFNRTIPPEIDVVNSLDQGNKLKVTFSTEVYSSWDPVTSTASGLLTGDHFSLSISGGRGGLKTDVPLLEGKGNDEKEWIILPVYNSIARDGYETIIVNKGTKPIYDKWGNTYDVQLIDTHTGQPNINNTSSLGDLDPKFQHVRAGIYNDKLTITFNSGVSGLKGEPLKRNSYIGIENYNGNKYVLNYDANYDGNGRAKPYIPNHKFGLNMGTYTLDVPQAHPIAILNKGKEALISYTGDPTKSFQKNIAPSGDTNATYEFFYGFVTITVTGNFESVSIYCYNHGHGYMGGEKLLEYIGPINSYSIKTRFDLKPSDFLLSITGGTAQSINITDVERTDIEGVVWIVRFSIKGIINGKEQITLDVNPNAKSIYSNNGSKLTSSNSSSVTVTVGSTSGSITSTGGGGGGGSTGGGGSSGGAIGDPYIYPILTNTPVKLPDKEAIYRLYEYDETFINGEVLENTPEHKQRIIDAFKEKIPEEEIINGYYFSRFHIREGNNYINIDLRKKTWKGFVNTEEFFDIVMNKDSSVEGFGHWKDVCDTLIISWKTKKNKMMKVKIYFSYNPYIENGIRIEPEQINEKAIGICVRNYKPKLMKLKNITQQKYNKLYKNIKKTRNPLQFKNIKKHNETWYK